MIKLLLDKKYPNLNPDLAIVLHVSLGDKQRTVNHLSLKSTKSSYHDFIPKDGETIRFVELKDGAWHAGRYNKPLTWVTELLRGRNPNKCTIGICYEGEPVDKYGNVTYDWDKVVDGEKATEKQIDDAVMLIKTYPKSAQEHFIAHTEIADDKPDCVLDFKHRVIDRLEEKEVSEEYKGCSVSIQQKLEKENSLLKHLLKLLVNKFLGK